MASDKEYVLNMQLLDVGLTWFVRLQVHDSFVLAAKRVCSVQDTSASLISDSRITTLGSGAVNSDMMLMMLTCASDPI